MPKVQTVVPYQWQFLGLKRFPDRLGSVELNQFFTFPPEDLNYVISRYEPRHHLGVALQLGFVRMTGSVLKKMPVQLPQGLMTHLAEQFQLPAPRIATLRSIYANKKSTWGDHQVEILKYLGFALKMTSKQEGGLTAHLNREARGKADLRHLTRSAMVWMFQKGYVIGGLDALETKASKVLERYGHALYQQILATVTAPQLDVWEKRVMERHPDDGITLLQWLGEPAKGRTTLNLLRGRLERIQVLHEMDVHKAVLKDVALDRILHFALELKHMRPSKWAKIEDDELRTIRLVCFLRNTLTEANDDAVAMFNRLLSQAIREAKTAAEKRDSEIAIAARSILNEIHHLYRDSNLPVEVAWKQLGEILAKDITRQFKSRAAAIRYILTEKGSPIRALLKEVDRLALKFGFDAELYDALVHIRGLWGRNPVLEPGKHVKVNSAWKELVNDPDRERAFRALECATLFAIRKGLRNGSVWIESSNTCRNRDELLLPFDDWDRNRNSYYDNLELPLDPVEVLDRYKKELRDKCRILAAQVTNGELTIRKGAIQFPAIRERDYPEEWDTAVETLGNRIPVVQLPDLILEVDARAGITKALLGRHARDEEELLQVYGGLLAHGCSIDATAVSLMVPGLSAEAVKIGQRLFHEGDAVRAAIEAVASYHRRFPVTSVWGDGTLASADMMAVDVSDKLWKSRIDPKRNVSSYGVYTTLSDHQILIYGQPVPLNERQAGVALESVLRQREGQVDQLAVDTHGYTDFAFNTAKLVHVDLCPQLKSMRDRKIHLPTEWAHFEGLEGITNNTIVMKNIRNHWDALVRIAASVESGHVNARVALAKFGSAAKGDPVYNAGVHFGRLCRSIFLCDYYLNDDFRHAMKNILSQGEAVHDLQRDIYTGSHAKPNHNEENLVALSLSLTLLTNMVIAWNTSRIQALLDENKSGIPEWMRVMKPARRAHINFRGTMKFQVRAYANRLIAGDSRRAIA